MGDNMISDTQGQDQVIAAPKKRVSPKFIAAVLLALVATYFLAPVLHLWSGGIPTVDQEDVIIAPVVRDDLIRDVAVNGKIVAANAPLLYSTEAGQVTLLAKPGETVTAGQLVARLESPELEAQIKQQTSALAQFKLDAKRGELANKEALLNLESELNSAISALNVAKREQERAELSYEKQVMSEVDYLKSQDRLDDASRAHLHAQKRMTFAEERLEFETQNLQFEVERQQLVLDELTRRLDELNITAPLAGVVGNWMVTQKSKVAPNTAVMSIVDLSEYEAELSVPEFYADELGLGLGVSMKIANNQVVGSIIAVSPEIKDNQVQVRVKLFDTESLPLRQNQRLNARIEFEKKSDVLMVKKGAFLGSLGGKSAYLLTAENSAVQVPISIGISSVEYIELLSGVKAGDQLIISDYGQYQHATEIRIQ